MDMCFPDPSKLKTKQIVFENVYLALDSGTLEQLKELSSKRRVLEESICKSSNITTAIAREISGGLTSQCEQDLQKLEQYLPLLENLVQHVYLNSCIVHLSSKLKIRWTSALTSSFFSSLKGSKFFQIDSLRFELGMTIFLYGAMLRERAREVLCTDLVLSTTLFRRAAGVFHYLGHEVLPSLQSVYAPEKPPEASSYVSNIMSLICLAEAQAVTIKKAEEKGNTGGLLAKLHYGIAQILDEATGLLHSAMTECKVISARFVDFISSCKDLHEFRSHKHLAEGLKIDGQIGFAIGVLRYALSNVQKKLPGEELWRSVFKQEINDVTHLLRKYEDENDFVSREKIPIHEELPLPRGTKIVSVIPYLPQRWERALAFKS